MVFTLLIAVAELALTEARGPRWTQHAVRPSSAQVARPEPSVGSLETMEQLTNPRTGVTCSMRILKAEPVDKAAVVPTPEQSVDPEIRGRVSPCLD